MQNKRDLNLNTDQDNALTQIRDLVHSQFTVLNAQTEATQSFGKAVGHLGGRIDQIAQKLNVLTDHFTSFETKLERSRENYEASEKNFSKIAESLQSALTAGQDNTHNVTNEILSCLKTFEAKWAEAQQTPEQKPTPQPPININRLAELDLIKHSSYRANVAFTSILQNFSSEVNKLQDLIQTLHETHREPSHTPMLENVLHTLTQDVTAVKEKITASSLVPENDEIYQQLQQIVEHLDTKTEKPIAQSLEGVETDLDPLPIFDPNSDRGTRALVGFQILLKDIQKLNEEYRNNVSEMKALSGGGSGLSIELPQYGETLEKLNKIVEALNTAQPQNATSLMQPAPIPAQNIMALADIEKTKTKYERFVVGLQSVLQNLSHETNHLHTLNQKLATAQNAVVAKASLPTQSHALSERPEIDDVAMRQQNVPALIAQALEQNFEHLLKPRLSQLEHALSDLITQKLQVLQNALATSVSQTSDHSLTERTDSPASLKHAITLMGSYAATIENGFNKLQNTLAPLSEAAHNDASQTLPYAHANELAEPLKSLLLRMQQQTSEFLAIAAALSHEIEASQENNKLT